MDVSGGVQHQLLPEILYKQSEGNHVLSKGPQLKPSHREYILDSGASLRMMGRSLFTPEERHSLRLTETRVAKGFVDVTHEAKACVKELHKFTDVKVVDDDAAVFSLGRLREELGHS